MICKNHRNEVAIEKCSNCGQWFCDDCITVDNIKASCNICLGKKTPNKEKVVIKDIIEEKTEAKPSNEPLKRTTITPMPTHMERQPRVINSKTQLTTSDIINNNNRIKSEITRRDNYTPVVSDNTALKKGIWRIASGLIVIVVGAEIFLPIVSIVGIVMVITAIIDIKSNY